MHVYQRTRQPNPPTSTIYHNARIFTAASDRPWAEALAVRDGRLIAVGTERHVRGAMGPDVDVIDLRGRFVMPGLCDSHIHLYETILAAQSVPLAGCTDLAQMTTRILEHANRTPPSAWLRGQGWNESRWSQPIYPTGADIDSVTGPMRPAIFWRSDMHVAVCNRAALAQAGITPETPDPAGGRIERDAAGAATGLLYDTAINLVARCIPPLDGPDLAAGIQAVGARLHRLGITAVHDQRLQSGDDGPRMLAAYRCLHAQGKLPLRIHCNISATRLDHALALGLASGVGDEWLRIGHVKFFTDGSLGSRTAWMLAPYTASEDDHSENTGLCVTDPDDLRRDFQRAMAGGLAISVHAIGDRANREVLDLFEELLPQHTASPLPHRIEHVQIMHPNDIPRLGALGLTASVQPVHALDDMEIATRYLGERGRWTYALRDLAQHGARLAFGSDAPVADPSPLLGIHAAVLRTRPDDSAGQAWQPNQGIDLAAAICAYTLGPAQAVACHHLYGTLEAGKCADFVVLGEDPFTRLSAAGRTANLATIPVDMTVLAGIPVYSISDSEQY